MEDVQDVDCAIVAVVHDEFKQIPLQEIKKIFKDRPDEEKVLIDVKGLYSVSELEATEMKWWRL